MPHTSRACGQVKPKTKNLQLSKLCRWLYAASVLKR